MRVFRNTRRAVLLIASLLSACAAADPAADMEGVKPASGVFGNYLAGRFALNHGDFGEAANELLRALASNPNDLELLNQTFIACLNAGRPEAVTLARRLPASQIAQMLLANDAAKAGTWDQAVSRFQSLPRDGVMQLLQPLLLAWAIQGSGNTQQALATLRPFFDNPRFRPLVALHAALIADLGGQPAEAAALFQQAESELTDQSPRTALILANWHARSGRQVEAERILTRMTASVPEAAIALPGLLAIVNKRPVARATDGMAEAYSTFSAALRTQETGDFAMVMSRLALDVRPDFVAARLLAADIQTTAKHYDSALMLLQEAARSNDPIVPIVRLHRVQVLERAERSEEAIREVERIGRDYPDSSLPDIQLGELLRVKRRFAESIVAYDRVINRLRQPMQNDWPLFFSRGVAYERTGQWARAEADLTRALQLSPDQPSVLNYLGYAWADMGRHLEQARDMIQRAAAKRPNDGAITDSLGWVMFRQGKIAEAVKLLERAVGLEPVDATITDHLGDAYWAIGRKIEAHYQWRRALTLKPAPEDAVKLEAKIKTHAFGTVASGQ